MTGHFIARTADNYPGTRLFITGIPGTRIQLTTQRVRAKVFTTKDEAYAAIAEFNSSFRFVVEDVVTQKVIGENPYPQEVEDAPRLL